MTIPSINSPGPTPPPRPMTPAQQEAANRELAEIAGSALAGGAIGSVVPGLGTALGAGIGFGIGVLNAMIDAAMTPQEQAPPGSDFPEQMPDLPPIQIGAATLVEDRTQAIAQMYRDILGREPDAVGLQGWVDGGRSLDQIRQDIANSPEGQQVARMRAENAHKADEIPSEPVPAAPVPIQQALSLWQEVVGTDYRGDGQFLQGLADELERGAAESEVRERIKQAAISRIANGAMTIPAGSTITPEEVVSQIFTDLTGQDINHAGSGPGPLAQQFREGKSFVQIREQMEETMRYRKEQYGN